MPYHHCCECHAEYWAERDGVLCPECDKAEQAAYHLACATAGPELPWAYSRPAMRERLGVTGDTDD